MKNPGKYESTLATLLKDIHLEHAADKPNFLELREAAYKLDELRGDIAHCSRHLAARLTSFAADIEEGRTHMSPPPSALDAAITEKNAVLNEKTTAFPTLLRLVLGPAAPKEFFRLFQES